MLTSLPGRLLIGATSTLGLLVAQCDPKSGPAPAPPSRATTTIVSAPRDTRTVVSPSTVHVVMTTVVATGMPPTIPTTTAAPAGPVGVYQHPNPLVERWHQPALEAGWPESDWPRLSCIIHRESGGNPKAHNPRDPGLGSFGLAQLNLSLGSSGTWALWGPGLGWDANRLYDGPTNLRYARELHQRAARMWGAPWQPWGPGRC